MALRLDPKKDAELLKKLGLASEQPKGKQLYRTRGFVDEKGDRWASAFEYECWLEIRSLIRDGTIIKAEKQVRFPLNAQDGSKVATWTCDFVITLASVPGEHPVDAKSHATLKKMTWRRIVRHFEAQYKTKIYVALQGETNMKKVCLQIEKDMLSL